MRIALVAAVLAGVAAPAAPAEEPVPTRDCRTRTEPTRGHLRFAEPQDVVVGPLSFSQLRRAASPRAAFRRDDGRLFVKAALKVLWGRPATLTVAGPERGLALEYVIAGGAWQPLQSVRFVGCKPGTPMWSGLRYRRVTGFNGGFSFARRGCYRVEVRVEGRAAPHRGRIPLGAPCR
jgi:hypothetical protein